MCSSYPSDSSRRYKRHSCPLGSLLLTSPVLYLQLFALSAWNEYSISQAAFWKIAAPVTGVIMAITIYHVVISQYEFRKIVRSIGRLFCRQRIDWPMSRSDAHAQKHYLEQLPLYRIKVEKCDPTTPIPSTALEAQKAQEAQEALVESAAAAVTRQASSPPSPPLPSPPPPSLPQVEYLLPLDRIYPTSRLHAKATS